MALTWLQVEQFRCIETVELELDPRFNFFVGANASGKTSLLEAVYFLGRGRSFRTRRLDALVRQGARAFVVVGKVADGADRVTVGVRGARGGTEVRVAGRAAQSVAELAEYFPPQVIDPEIHKLLEEGPGRRRRFLDWGVFHVEPLFLQTWQRYHRALRQRNAALKQGLGEAATSVWIRELAESGELLAGQRAAYVKRLEGPVGTLAERFLGMRASLVYHRGWQEAVSLEEAIARDGERDRRLGATQHGPHRGDVVVKMGGQLAKDRVSRGQQKLLAAALTLAQVIVQEESRPGRSALLLDDPAAELDLENLGRLLECVRELPVQLFVTSLRGEVPGLPKTGRRFHVERGRIQAA